MLALLSVTRLILAAVIAASVSSADADPAPTVRRSTTTPGRELVIRIQIDDQAITPITARFIRRGLDTARRRNAAFVLIELDTPGGLVDSTRAIVKDVLASPVPVIVHVAPAGARAASAGVFITLAADVAAMAPGTAIGAAHPVAIGNLPTGRKGDDEDAGPSVLEEKIVNDTRAWARSLANLKGRNAKVAEEMVAKSTSLSAGEAAAANIVDFVAADTSELLSKLGIPDAVIEPLELGWGQRILAVLANPNVAFLLIVVGFYALIFELYTPTMGVAGVAGAICLVLGLFGLAVLPLSFAGLALIGIGLALLVAEAFVTSFGLLTLGGVVCIIIGGLILIDSPAGFLRVSTAVIVPVALAGGVIGLLLTANSLRAQRAPIQTGIELLLREQGVAQERFQQGPVGIYRGVVRTHGEIWQAQSSTPLEAGETVDIRARDGMTLTVEPPTPARGNERRDGRPDAPGDEP